MVPTTLTAWKSAMSWLAPPSSAAVWMAASHPLAAARTSSAPGDVALDQLDAQVAECGCLVGIADECADVVAALEQLLGRRWPR